MARPPRPVDPPAQKPEELDAAFVKRGITPEWETLFKEVPPLEARDYLNDRLEARRKRRDLIGKMTSEMLSKVSAAAGVGALWAFVEYLRRWTGK
jgi:hypothetical protein